MPEPTELTPLEQTPPTETQAPPKVIFDDAHKARIQEIVKEASARAGSEARAEVARLKATLPVAEPQSTDALLRLAQAEAELASLRAESEESKVREVLHQAVSKEAFFDPDLASQILRSSLKVINGQPTVVDGTGTPRLNADFSGPMTPSDLARELANQKKFLVRSTLTNGTGSLMSTNRVETGPALETLFGKGADNAAAMRLGKKNIALYRRLREQARAQGLI